MMAMAGIPSFWSMLRGDIVTEEKPHVVTFEQQAAGKIVGAALGTAASLIEGNAAQFAANVEKLVSGGMSKSAAIDYLYDHYKTREEALADIISAIMGD